MLDKTDAVDIARRHGKSEMTRTYLDYAAENPKLVFMLGTSDPARWEKYLKENHPACKFKIVEGGIILNPKSP